MALTRITTDGITDGSIINVDINASAAIASSKISGLVGGATGVDFNDNVKARWGTGNDLQIFHDGTDSIISNATNVLKTHSTNTYLRNAAGNEELATFTQDGAVKLYYDNSKKFETTSYGSAHTGVMRFENSGDGISLYDSRELKLGNGDDLKIYHDGTDNYWETGATTTHFRVNSGNRLTINGTTGDVSMQGSSGKNFLWDNSAAYLNLNDNAKATYGTGNDLQIYHDGSHSRLKNTTGWVVIESDNTQIADSAGADIMANFIHDGSVELYYDGSKKLETTSTGATISGSLICQDTGEYQIVLKDTNNTGQGAEMAMGFKDSANTVQGWIGFNKWEDDDFHVANNNSGGYINFHTHNGTSLGERLRIKSNGELLVKGRTGLSSSTTVYSSEVEDFRIGLKHFRSVYYNTGEVNSPLNLPNVVPDGTAGEITIVIGWANNNGCRISKTAYAHSNARSVSERYNFQANASGVSLSLGAISIDTDGDIDFTFSDNQGNKVQNVRVFIEYFIQQGEPNLT